MRTKTLTLVVFLLLASCDMRSDKGLITESSGQSKLNRVDIKQMKVPKNAFKHSSELKPAMSKNGFCAIDKINGQLAGDQVVNVERDGKMRVSGWAAVGKFHVPQEINLALRAKGSMVYLGAADTGADRPDVARSVGSANLAKSGFNAMLSTADINPGRYELSILAVKDGESFECQTRSSIYVLNSPWKSLNNASR